MALFEIKEAKREASPVFMGFVGQSGSGKTLSALLFARGLVGPTGKIGLVDTEGKRALIYADDPQVGGFHHADFVAPYSSKRFREALREMIAAGMDAVIFDSASHEHEAEGGMLDMAEQHTGNPRGKWIKPKMEHGRFITACRGAPIHVIFCIREKVIIDIDAKPKPEKIYLPVCDRDLPFEFMLTIRLEPETHRATFIKVPKPYLQHISDGEVVTVEHGRLLMAEAGRGDKPESGTAAIIAALQSAADDGPETLTEAYRKAWREAGPQASTEDLKKLTPRRAELQKHAEGLKLRAAKADKAKAEGGNTAEPEAGEIGTIERTERPFPGDDDDSLFNPKGADDK